MPMEMGVKLLASEAATLRYLRAYSDIPVPEVHDYCASRDNDIGIPFIIMSQAPGCPLSNFWKPAGSQPGLDSLNKAKVLAQLGGITWKLSQLRFDKKIGSLFEDDNSFDIGECLSCGHMLHERYDLEIPRGPFTSEAEFHDSLISAFSGHAESLPLSHHCFLAPVPSPDDYQSDVQYRGAVKLWNDFVIVGRKPDSSENRLDYIIAGDALRERRRQLPAVNFETFPLCHPDLSVNNIYM